MNSSEDQDKNNDATNKKRQLIKDLMESLEAEFQGVELYLSYDKYNDMIVLSKIVVNKQHRNKGIGTAVMQRITDFADRNNLKIGLSPSGDFGGSKRRLNKFYGNLGFKNYKGYQHREKMQREPSDKTIKLSEILFEGIDMSDDDISEKIRSLKIYGFGGFCGDAAVHINKQVFNNKGTYVIAANKFLWETAQRVVGHVAVEYNGVYWDSDAEPKEQEDIESWGMVDPEDPEYMDLDGWTEEAAYEVEWMDDLSEQEVMELMPCPV